VKILRRILAWFLFWIGALVLSVWASASFITHKVDSGSIASPIISSILHQEHIQSMIAEQAQSLIADELLQNGIPIAGTPEEQELNAAIATAVSSDDFIDDLTDVIREVEASIISQLTDDTLPLEPLVITFDITEPLYTALEASPEIAALVPPTALEPVTIDPLDADEVGKVRDGYDWVQLASGWGLWIGLGLLALGFVIMPGKRWIIPKILLGLGITVLVGWFIASRLTTEWVLDRLPDDADPEFRETVADFFSQDRIDGVQSDLWKWSVILLFLSAVAYTLVWFLFRKRRPKKEVVPEPEPEPVPVTARTATSASAATTPAAPTTPVTPETPETPTTPSVPEDTGPSVGDHEEPGEPPKDSADPSAPTG